MTSADEHEREPAGDEMRAAEYALGVLSADDRRAVERRMETDPEFTRRVERWYDLLSPLASEYADVEPPASVKSALDRRLSAEAEPPTPATPGIWHSVIFWRGLAAAALAALVLYVSVPLVRPTIDAKPGVRLVASLAGAGSDVRYIALYDAAHKRVGLSHLSGERGPDRDFELWAIRGKNPPLSLGVVPVGQTVGLTITEDARAKLAQSVIFAISVEPRGGSPTGQPTGPVVATGTLMKL